MEPRRRGVAFSAETRKNTPRRPNHLVDRSLTTKGKYGRGVEVVAARLEGGRPQGRE